MKIDRVTFGIMSRSDRDRAMQLTPNMPRSRLMLAIPFVGKDVPSDASEFAHPDIIIGLTVLAFRYEGVRFTDFKEILSSIRDAALKEYGPWPERKNNIRYESWVRSAGGKVRGHVDYRSMSRELIGAASEICEEVAEAGSASTAMPAVISLRLLKQSSREHILELYNLLRKSPDMIHWYLNEFVFPTYMRFQNTKISASGQDLGGNMLFPRRVGFSGTPSDLLPVELGRCHYERGSDGLVINTLTDTSVVSFDVVEPTWTPTSLLDKIARENCYHALIDTGALITGLSNLDVAKYLLRAGLEGKEGVVFLDEMDRKMIIVRATGRVLKLEECGIPLENRFAFYDQIHTTGMDIKHTPNAVAVLTLGKDMTFRDYAQGAFRMRGIARGQKIHLLVTPELRELMLRELRAASHPTVEPPQVAPFLREAAAWLVINSMASERLQFNQLCVQNVTNVYRKNGFANLLKGPSRFKISEDMRADHCLGPSLHMFYEPVEFTLETSVPEPRLFSEIIANLIKDKREMFITDTAEVKTIDSIQQMVVGLVEEGQERAFNQDMVREQEEEKEKMKEVVEEKELEITQFKDQQYARDMEEPTPWLFCALSSISEPLEGDQPIFYPASEFRLFARQPIHFPKYMMVSSNYFDKRWSGHRRVKNVTVVMDWTCDRTTLRACAPPIAGAPKQHTLQRTFQLLDHAGKKELSLSDVASLSRTAFETDVEAEWLEQMLMGRATIPFADAEAFLGGPTFRQEQSGRNFVALSLIEAETVRRILHVKHGSELIETNSTDIALRVVGAGDYVMDVSSRYSTPPRYQTEVVHQSFRYLDCETHFRDSEINHLLKGVQCNATFERRLFFEQIIGCKRREQKAWEKTAVSRIFSIQHEYVLLHLRTLALRVRDLVRQHELLPYDAFQKFDFGRVGALSAGNIFAAFRWLGLDVSHEDWTTSRWQIHEETAASATPSGWK